MSEHNHPPSLLNLRARTHHATRALTQAGAAAVAALLLAQRLDPADSVSGLGVTVRGVPWHPLLMRAGSLIIGPDQGPASCSRGPPSRTSGSSSLRARISH